MSLIITATDFSTTANHALRYAAALATKHKAQLTVLHSYTVPVAISETPMPVMSIEECREVAEKGIAKVVDELTVSFPDIAINGVTMFGDITEVLTDYANEKSPWMIVLGNSLHDEDSVWFSGNLIDIMRELHHPVLAVPTGCDYKEVEKLCFACDYKKDTTTLPLGMITAIAHQTGAALHVVNVDHNSEHFSTDTPEINEMLHAALAVAKPEYHYVEGEDVDAAIQDFADNNDIDWLIVAPHKHGFFERIFHKSHTKALARSINIPLLALH
ncbi:MAG TPA: universal stress protein [Flavipsychrobacter sp.]|nr:universal stress protein [Flavipsychrobacter sp.]